MGRQEEGGGEGRHEKEGRGAIGKRKGKAERGDKRMEIREEVEREGGGKGEGEG